MNYFKVYSFAFVLTVLMTVKVRDIGYERPSFTYEINLSFSFDNLIERIKSLPDVRLFISPGFNYDILYMC